MEEWPVEGERGFRLQVDGNRGCIMNGSGEIMTLFSRIAQ